MHVQTILTVVIGVGLVGGVAHSGEQPGLPDHVRASGDYMVGCWSGVGESQGQPATMQLTMRWAPGNQHQLYDWIITTSDGARVFGNAVGGLDRNRNRWVEYMIESDGSHWTNWWPESLEGDVANTRYHGEQFGYRNGELVKVATLTLERRGPDEWTFEVETVESPPQVLLSMTFRRDKEGEPTED